MSVGLEQVSRELAAYLSQRGVPAVTAFPASPRKEETEPVAVVSLRGCRTAPFGFRNYLGEQYAEETGRWEERYGHRAELTFGLDLYAPERGDGESLQKAFDALAGVLLLNGPEGMELKELSCGETVRDGESRRLKRPVEAVFVLCLSAVVDAGGIFTDFELRGVVKE